MAEQEDQQSNRTICKENGQGFCAKLGEAVKGQEHCLGVSVVLVEGYHCMVYTAQNINNVLIFENIDELYYLALRIIAPFGSLDLPVKWCQIVFDEHCETRPQISFTSLLLKDSLRILGQSCYERFKVHSVEAHHLLSF